MTEPREPDLTRWRRIRLNEPENNMAGPGDQDLAMQHHCLACGKEQWAPAVWAISIGLAGCSWCGVKGERMGKEEYDERRRAAPHGERVKQMEEGEEQG